MPRHASRRGYGFLGLHWAGIGPASLHLQHVGSDHNVWLGNPLGMIGRLQGAAQEREAIARAQGLRFTLDPLLAARAAIVLSAPPFYGEAEPARILAPVTLPSLHVTATGDVIRIPGYYSGAEDRVAVFEATGSARKALAVFDGGSHSMFTDRAGTGGVELNPQVKAATQALSLAFLHHVFGQGDAGALALWAERHRTILAKFVAMKGASA